MRLFVVRDPRHNSLISDCLFSYDSDSMGLPNYIAGCGRDVWENENHRIHTTLEDALKDLCNRCVAFEKSLSALRIEIVEQIRQIENEKED